MTRLLVAGLVVALLMACSGRQQESELKRQVDLFCDDLAFKIGQAAEQQTRIETHDIYERFLFCVNVRKIDEKRRDEIKRRVGSLEQALREQQFATQAEAAKTLNELAAIAREINELPLVE